MKQFNHCKWLSYVWQLPFTPLLRVMKLTAIIMLAACLSVRASGYSQKVSLSVENTSIEKVFRSIHAQSGYNFLFTNKVVAHAKRVNIVIKNGSIEQVLDLCFRGQPLSYTIIEKTIVVKIKEEEKVVKAKPFDLVIPTPPIRIKGKVINEKGEALAGVGIKIKNANGGTATNNEGYYEINVPDNKAILEFSYVGYIAKAIAVSDSTIVNVMLSAENRKLDDIVVVGYGTTKKIDVTGSISSIKGNDIQNLPVSTVANALDGRASGVSIVRNDGSPGASPSIRIRGTGTINDAEPLVVIDGVPAGNLSDVNPNDIASVEILKDASSSAIYGTRAANGVILVTTKKGNYNQKLSTTFNAYSGFSNSPRYLKLLSAPDLFKLKRERYTNDNAAIEDPWNDTYYSVQRTDWQRAIMGVGKVTSGDIALQGGNEFSNYYISASVYDEKGIINKTNFKRYSTRINSEHKIKSFIKIGENLQLTYGGSNAFDNNNSQTGLIFSALRFNPAIPLVNPNGSYGTSQAFANQLGDINSPYATIQEADGSSHNFRAIANAFGEIEFIKGLKLRINYAFDGTMSKSQGFSVKDINQARPNTFSVSGESEGESSSQLFESFITYDKMFNKSHLTLTGGYSSQNFKGSGFNASRIGYDDVASDQRTLTRGNTLLDASGGVNDPSALESGFARGFYDYNGKYLATLTFRADGSSKFAPGKRWGYFPAFSLGWRLSNEQFIKNISWINNLKLTGGWGELGNQNIGGFQYASTIAVSSGYQPSLGYYSGYSFGGSGLNGAYITTLANPDITWERAAMTNISLEAGFLHNKLTAIVTYFNKTTNKMLVPSSEVGTAGHVTIPDKNIANMNNHGIEAEFNYQGGQKLKYSVGVNASFIKNKVTKLYGNSAFIGSAVYGRSSQEISRTYEGQPIASFYGWKTKGLYQTQADIDNDPNIKNDPRKGSIKPGDVHFLDVNSDGIIDGNDRTYLGNPNPDVTGGIQASLSYKGFDLAANFVGVFGVSLYNADRMQGIDPTYPFNMYEETINRWTGPGTSNTIPRMTLDRANDNYRTSDLFIESGNYFSLKNLTVGYTLPAGWMKKATLNSFRIYVSGQNLFMLTRYQGYTPELGYTDGNKQRGVDVAQYPSVRSFTFGLTVKL